MPLTSETTLELVDGMSLIRTRSTYRLSFGNVSLHGGRYTLSILDVFATPRSLRDGLEALELRIRSMHGWAEAVAQIKELYEVGVLREPGGDPGIRRAHEKRFDSAPVHIRMLDDDRRTSLFQSAIRGAVGPNDVVLDIGSGTGVLAVTAALAGARHVYAVEATAMSGVVRRLAEGNGVGDRVTVIEAHSSDVELAEKANVLVSETIGDDPLGEHILTTFADARLRLLGEGARAIPCRLRVLALLLEVPDAVVRSHRFTPDRIGAWGERYGLDFRGLVSATDQDHLVHINSYDTRTWTRLSDPIVVADFELLRSEPQAIDERVPVRATAAGCASAALLFFDADLGSGVHLSVHPDDATATNSWGNLLYLFAQPVDVTAGDAIDMLYSFRDGASRIRLLV